MIEIKNLSFNYGDNAVLDDVSFSMQPGECVALLGNNGAGKSTLVTCVNKIRTPKSGKVLFDGVDIMKLGRIETAKCISYVAQKNEINSMTVFDSVLLGRRPYIKWAVSQHDIDICDNMLETLGLGDMKLKYIDEMSGGELQKVMLARALVQEPKLILLDEPTSNLDPKNQYETMQLVHTVVKQRNINALIVIHDLNLALRYCDRFVLLKDNKLYKSGDISIITNEAISEVYGVNAVVTEAAGQKVVIIDA